MTLEVLPRVWWFPEVELLDRIVLHEFGTYCGYELDAQPPLRNVDPNLGWLTAEPLHDEWNLDETDATPQRRMRSTNLAEVLHGSRSPTALERLAGDPELQRRIRSSTGCYLDLGDKAAPTEDGGVLLHVLSDQQWVRHWLVLIETTGRAPVVSTTRPIGFDLPDDWYEDIDEERLPDRIRLDGSLDLTVVADSFEEFLYRLWLENEIFFRAVAGDPLTEVQREYVRGLRQ